MQLFRPEAMRGYDRLHGEVVLVPPLSWQLLGGFMLVAIATVAIFLSTAQYSKVTTLEGRLTASKGVLRAVSPRDGMVEAVLVSENQRVEAGTPLARISIVTHDGQSSLEERRSAAIARRDDLLRGSAPELARAFRARRAALLAQMAGDQAEAGSIAEQIAEQSALVRSAREELERARTVAERGFVSQRDVLQREEQLATRRQGLSRLEQELSARRARLSAARADLARAQTEYDLQRSELDGARAELAGSAAAADNVSTIVITAAEAGIVTGIGVHAGEAIAAGGHLMSVVPSGSRLEARIELPPAAAGFIAPGQKVRLAVDAFPYQIYGTVDAVIETVSAATVPVAGAGGSGEAFLVRAAVQAEAISAYGRSQPLRPGMTVTARITTQSQSLGQWLFDPLYAVGRR